MHVRCPPLARVIVSIPTDPWRGSWCPSLLISQISPVCTEPSDPTRMRTQEVQPAWPGLAEQGPCFPNLLFSVI